VILLEREERRETREERGDRREERGEKRERDSVAIYKHILLF
jgi:hypothetical protein